MSPDTHAACKVDRVAEKWGLPTVDERLGRRWREGESLRDLETFFNETVLRAAMRSGEMNALDGEATNLYRLLTDDEVSAGQRVDAESRLRRNGVDPASVRDDFVSYQTIRTHLNDCLDVETARDTDIDPGEARNTVFKLLSRAESVTERTLERLAADGSVTVASPTVTLSLRVACADCGDEYTLGQLFERGGCSCPDE